MTQLIKKKWFNKNQILPVDKILEYQEEKGSYFLTLIKNISEKANTLRNDKQSNKQTKSFSLCNQKQDQMIILIIHNQCCLCIQKTGSSRQDLVISQKAVRTKWIKTNYKIESPHTKNQLYLYRLTTNNDKM